MASTRRRKKQPPNAAPAVALAAEGCRTSNVIPRRNPNIRPNIEILDVDPDIEILDVDPDIEIPDIDPGLDPLDVESDLETSDSDPEDDEGQKGDTATLSETHNWDIVSGTIMNLEQDVLNLLLEAGVDKTTLDGASLDVFGTSAHSVAMRASKKIQETVIALPDNDPQLSALLDISTDICAQFDFVIIICRISPDQEGYATMSHRWRRLKKQQRYQL
ncbi:hypothetical protein C8A00DRAFT_30296 [Chaetomidium leptoderma]|uniref:Uncharacterized protein n=1 Tax=Chaetomidium leptoderma TaxID=669021 RepID=A0AAN6VS87_9PEZI|nr:hypothetical protein C8A00DRAFT_30296 [Chaetomidium leptoderma]